MAAAQNPGNFKGFKPPKFDGYDGDSWMMFFEEYLQTPQVLAAQLDDRQKIVLALFHMEGKAKMWKNSMLKKYQTQAAAVPPVAWPTWAQFKTTFIGKWGDSNAQAKAFRELQMYTYDKRRKDSLRDTLLKVDTLLQNAEITSEEQKKTFL